MAWRSSGPTNEALIANLRRNGLIRSERVKEAMLKVRRRARPPDATCRLKCGCASGRPRTLRACFAVR